MATVSYDSTAGTTIFTITTREAPTPNPGLAAGGALGTVPGGCNGLAGTASGFTAKGSLVVKLKR